MLRCLVQLLLLAAVGVALAAGQATARSSSRTEAPSATVARACHNHAGTPEGDGEYSDGAIQDAIGISCAKALALVKPRYHWIYAHWEKAYHHGFKLAAFSCKITPDGPDDLKTCVDGARHFDFL